MIRYHRAILSILAILLGIVGEPRPTQGGEWSPGYKAGLKRTAELKKAKISRMRAAGMKQRAAIQAAAMQEAAMQQMAMQAEFMRAQAYQAAMGRAMQRWGYGVVGGGSAPEIDAGPAAGAMALLVAGVLMLADRRRAAAA